MAQYQLKVMLNTSIPASVGYTELTIDMLNYAPPPGKGVGKILEKYPFFDPFANYPRQVIQDLEYYKRLEVFFNEEKFKSVVLQYSSQTKEKLEKKYKKTRIGGGVEEADEAGNTADMNENRISNFEFTIQTILCTGFPVNNYFQSIEYYNPKVRTKSMTLKGSSWFPFLPGRFDRKFSHLKIKDAIYTVTGVVWVNDAFNHPKYAPVLESYGKYSEEKIPAKIDKKLDDAADKREVEMNMFLLNVYRDNLNQSTTVWKSAKLKDLKKRRDGGGRGLSDRELNSLDIQIAFQENIIQSLLFAPQINNLFDTLDISGQYYSRIGSDDDIKNNIFYFRGPTTYYEENKSEREKINKQPVENQAYFYWKQVLEFDINPPGKEKSLNGCQYDVTAPIFHNTPPTTTEFSKAIQGKQQELYSAIEDTYKKKQSFKQDIIPAKELVFFLEDYGLNATYSIEKKKNNEIYWLYKVLIENYKDIKKREETLPSSEKKRGYKTLIGLVENFIDVGNKQVKENLETFMGKFTDEQFKMLGNVNYADQLRTFIRKMRGYDMEKRAYTYVQTNADYADDPNKTEIDVIIAQQFKNFNVYSNSLKELANTRIVSNPYWKLETDKFVGTKKGKITLKEKDKGDMFGILTNCKEFNSRCRKSKQAADYLYTGIDELKHTPGSGLTTYEAYIQTNVIKGKITKENYSYLKCAYLNYSLGAMYQRMRKKTRENYIVKNKVYFDLEDKIKQVEIDMKKKRIDFWPSFFKKDVKKAPVDKKKGGRATRKHKNRVVVKKGFRYTRKKTSLLGIDNKTRKMRQGVVASTNNYS